jgi:hypothetical protein
MAGKNIVIKIEGDGESARHALEMVREQLAETRAKAAEEGSGIEHAMERVASTLENVGIYIGIREAIEGLKEMVGGAVELGVELGHLHEQTGISTQNLSVMKYMAQSTGVEFEALTKGFKKFSTDIRDADEGTKKAVESFGRLGITQRQVKDSGGDMYTMLGLVADRFKSMADGPLKAASAVDLFGKGGLALIPILNQGKAGIEEFRAEAQSLGLVLDEEGVAKMEALHQASVKLHGALEGMALGLVSGLEPALSNLGEALTSVTGKENAFAAAGNWTGGAITYVAEAVAYLVKFLRQAYDEYEALGALVNGTERKIASVLDVGSEARARAAQGYKDQVAIEKAALKDREQAETDYHAFVQKLQATHAAPKPSESGSDDPTLMQQGEKRKSGDAIDRSLAELLAQAGKNEADARRNADQVIIAQVEAAHKEQMISDALFYAMKLAAQQDEIDAEISGLQNKQVALQALEEKQKADKLLHRDKSGNSSEENQTKRQLLEVQDKLNELQAKSLELKAAYGAEVAGGAASAELMNLKAAADLEKEKGRGVAAQITLLTRQHELEAQGRIRVGGPGADLAAQQIRDAGQIAAAKLRIEDISKQITASTEQEKAAVDALADAAKKDPRLKRETIGEINALNKAEAEQLKVLVAAYDELAKELGGEYLTKSKQLHTQITELSTPDKKIDAKPQEELIKGIGSMIDKLAEETVKGKTSFHEMAKGIEQDVVQMAIKFAEQKWLLPMIAGAVGGDKGVQQASSLFSGARASGGPVEAGKTYLVGENGPEPFTPGVGGHISPTSTLQQIAKSSGGGGAPNVTTNIINNSSQPVQAQPSQVSYDSQMKQFIIHTILEDQASGGATAVANGQMG